MVHDVRSAVDFVVEGRGKAKGKLPAFNKNQVYVLGYSMGGMVGLYSAALDKRITGVASFSGFTPLRTDTDTKPTGGIRRLYQWHALQPKLGLFQGHEQDIPYDFDHLLAMIAPRPCLIVSPKRDRKADFAEVFACMKRAAGAWKAKGTEYALTHHMPDDVNRFQAEQQALFIDWYRRQGQEGRALDPQP